MRTNWYSRWRGAVIIILILLIALLTSLALVGNQWILKVLDPGTSAYQTWTAGEPVTTIALSPDSQLIAIGLRSGDIQIRLVADGNTVRTLDAHTSKVNALKFSHDGQLLASAAADGVTLWRVDGYDSHHLVQQYDANYWLRDDSLQTLAFSPDRNMLAVPGLNGAVEVWQVDGIDSQILVKTFKAQGAVVSALAFLADGKSLIVGYTDGSVRQWQLPEGQLLFSQTQYVDEFAIVNSIALDPTGQIVAVAQQMNSDVRVWRLKDGQQLQIFTEHRTDIWSLDFSPDGQLLASGGGRSLVSDQANDNTIHVWQVDDGSERVKFTGHTDSVTCLAWSPDGRLLASGSDDGTVRLWQLK